MIYIKSEYIILLNILYYFSKEYGKYALYQCISQIFHVRNILLS